MRIFTALLVLLTLLPAQAERRPRPEICRKCINLEFVNADLVYVVKVLAKEMGRKVYIGPGVEGSATLQLREVPAQAALDMILKMQELSIGYKFLEPGALVVAAPEKLGQIESVIVGCGRTVEEPPIGSLRQEILLESGVPVAKVVGFLQGQYPQVEFIPHPTKNGFYAVGLRQHLLAIKNQIPNLDRVPDVPPPPAKEFVQIRYGDLNEVKALLATLVPDVQMSVDIRQSTLILEGAPGAIEQARELLDQLDKPLDQVVMECKVVLMDEREEERFGIDWTRTVPAQSSNDQESNAELNVGYSEPSSLRTRANLNFLISRSDSGVLASPTIPLESGHSIAIAMVDRCRLDDFESGTGEFKTRIVEVGLKLDVATTLVEGNRIDCKCHLWSSTSKRTLEAELDFTAADGQTVAIGGLIDSEESSAGERLPLLGHLPIWGIFYRNTSVTKQKRRPLVFLTPQIMK